MKRYNKFIHTGKLCKSKAADNSRGKAGSEVNANRIPPVNFWKFVWLIALIFLHS